jgi:hypothetical protein
VFRNRESFRWPLCFAVAKIHERRDAKTQRHSPEIYPAAVGSMCQCPRNRGLEAKGARLFYHRFYVWDGVVKFHLCTQRSLFAPINTIKVRRESTEAPKTMNDVKQEYQIKDSSCVFARMAMQTCRFHDKDEEQAPQIGVQDSSRRHQSSLPQNLEPGGSPRPAHSTVSCSSTFVAWNHPLRC